MRYFDASALVKRYVAEPESLAVQRLLARGVPATSRLSEVEVASALVRRCREGGVSPEERDRGLAGLQQDMGTMYLVEVSAAIVASACTVLRRHLLRGADALHLASCLHLASQLGEPVELVVYDLALARAARDEGLGVVAPK